MSDSPRPVPEIKPRHFPPPPPLVEKTPGLWRRTPPAIFPPMMGLFGLGHAWRVLAAQPGLEPLAPVGEAILGATLLLFAFGLVAWMTKPLRRPGVLIEELAVLPGRAGVVAMVLCLLLSAGALWPYAPGLATALAGIGIVALAALGTLIAVLLLRGPDEARTVTPVFHLTYVGYIIAPTALVPLGYHGLGTTILAITIVFAVLIWLASLRQLVSRVPPPPLRPLLAIHLAPASLFATVSALLAYDSLAFGFALLAMAFLATLLISARWILAAGFSPFWGALTFPLAASATASILALGSVGPWIGVVLIIIASALNPLVAQKVVKLWAKGELGAKTNAATA
jgi:tellurite resistance protein